MPCYCANYYGSVNCHNTVTRFGDRCKLCLALKSGASLSDGILPDEDLWMITPKGKDGSHHRSRTETSTRSMRVKN